MQDEDRRRHVKARGSIIFWLLAKNAEISFSEDEKMEKKAKRQEREGMAHSEKQKQKGEGKKKEEVAEQKDDETA